MKEKRMGWNEKHRLFHDKVIELYLNYGFGSKRISRLVPVSKTSIRRWIINFVAENDVQQFPKMKQANRKNNAQTANNDECASLKAELNRVKKQLRYEQMRAEAFNVMIDIAEKEFKIPIRKKHGAKQ